MYITLKKGYYCLNYLAYVLCEKDKCIDRFSSLYLCIFKVKSVIINNNKTKKLWKNLCHVNNKIIRWIHFGIISKKFVKVQIQTFRIKY